MPVRKRSRDRARGSRPLPGIIEEARQALTDDSFGVRHDAFDQLRGMSASPVERNEWAGLVIFQPDPGYCSFVPF
ncbi:hypothetical protein CQ10_05835 [Bradyrhizobium valentinum]|uniref:Uncharacterized protein n=1 Tax=Bradyrhizobium valentinum TaxID=1518501 RepID=A0A0R3KR75_9BRAD|nr:hypothetical protein CQ10_05835 [Bradyrhizobium valentinum]KRR09223.1 hypothetical protein CP49_09590 [Bradyrhizobium valentinum]